MTVYSPFRGKIYFPVPWIWVGPVTAQPTAGGRSNSELVTDLRLKKILVSFTFALLETSELPFKESNYTAGANILTIHEQ